MNASVPGQGEPVRLLVRAGYMAGAPRARAAAARAARPSRARGARPRPSLSAPSHPTTCPAATRLRNSRARSLVRPLPPAHRGPDCAGDARARAGGQADVSALVPHRVHRFAARRPLALHRLLVAQNARARPPAPAPAPRARHTRRSRAAGPIGHSPTPRAAAQEHGSDSFTVGRDNEPALRLVAALLRSVSCCSSSARSRRARRSGTRPSCTRAPGSAATRANAPNRSQSRAGAPRRRLRRSQGVC